MTEPLDRPSDRREKPEGAPHTAAPRAYPYPYPPGYPAVPQYGYQSAPDAPKNGVGIASLVLAIIGLLTVWTVFVAIALGPAAMIVGFVGRARVKRGAANNGGVAVAGILLGALAIVVGVAFIPIYTVVFKEVRVGDYMDCVQKANNDRVAEQRCVEQFRQKVQNKLSVTLTPTPLP
jgi:hypothetical protein